MSEVAPTFVNTGSHCILCQVSDFFIRFLLRARELEWCLATRRVRQPSISESVKLNSDTSINSSWSITASTNPFLLAYSHSLRWNRVKVEPGAEPSAVTRECLGSNYRFRLLRARLSAAPCKLPCLANTISVHEVTLWDLRPIYYYVLYPLGLKYPP